MTKVKTPPEQSGNGRRGGRGVAADKVPEGHSAATWAKPAAVELHNVSKAFGDFRVLDHVSCHIPRGEITVLMGPSGVGKSVTLRHIVGLLAPDEGRVVVEGQDVGTLNERDLLALRRSIGMLFQDGALFSSMNIYDNVAFPLRQHTKRSESEIREIVTSRLDEVGLGAAALRLPNEISGGMRKRAGFARALVLEPKVLLFDEPDSGLDPVRTTLLCELIRNISRHYEATAIVVSHDVGAVRRFADNIGLLYEGKMRLFGSREEVENSDDPFAQQFLAASPDGPLGMD